MRTTIVLLAVAVLVVAVLAACRARDDSAADSATDDSARADDSATDSGVAVTDTASSSTSVPPTVTSRTSPPAVRRAGDPRHDSTLPPEDSIRAMRPELPQVTPGKRPRTWRGLKLPEEMPVRAPLDTIRLEQMPDSVMKGDSTKPPKPQR